MLWATPFSVFRWAVPHVCNYEGKAIYMDVDMIARADIAELWNQHIPLGKAMLWKDEKHSCVMLFDCAAMKGVMPPFEQMRRKHGGYSVYRDVNARPAANRFIGDWNCLDGGNYPTLDDPDIKIIHFTRVETQPHLKWALPRLKAAGMQHWNRQAQGIAARAQGRAATGRSDMERGAGSRIYGGQIYSRNQVWPIQRRARRG